MNRLDLVQESIVWLARLCLALEFLSELGCSRRISTGFLGYGFILVLGTFGSGSSTGLTQSLTAPS
jgi:hypothetical protein